MSDADQAGGRTRAPEIDDFDLDMTGVDPLRLGEIRRRVGVVKSYLLLPEPSDADRKYHAEQLGLSVNQFLALVRAWREHGRAVAISCAGAAKGAPRPKSARNLPAASKAAAADVIAKLGPDTSLVETIRLVRKACDAFQAKPPSRSTIWNMVMANRKSRAEAGRDGIAVSRCHVRVPVRCGEGMEFPKLALAVDRQTGSILAAAMDGDATTALTIAAGIDVGPAHGPIIIDADLAKIVRAHTLVRFTSVAPTAARTDTAKILGRGFGSLDLIYQASRAIKPIDMLRSKKDAPLAPADARRAIAQQLSAHNAARGAAPPFMSWIA
jgi:hypothetical protein